MTTKTTRTRRSAKKDVEPLTSSLKPNLTVKDYVDDFKIRVKIHNYEVDLLVKDIKSSYQKIKPSLDKVVNYLKESYNNEFNTKEG